MPEHLIGNTPKKLLVVHLAETVKGGVATYLSTILEHQRANEYLSPEPLAIVPRDQRKYVSGDEKDFATFTPSKFRVVGAIRAFLALVVVCRQSKVDLIHLHSTFAGLVCRPLIPFFVRGKPVVVYCSHGWAFDRHGGRIYQRAIACLERVLSSFCDKIVCISNHEHRLALEIGISPQKAVVIRNGLPDRMAAPFADAEETDCLKLIFVGRLDRQKGFDVLMRALALVQRQVQLDVFGEFVVDGALDDPFDTANPNVQIRCHGWREFDEIEPYLCSADALVMPSRWEGFGLTAVEAMRAGTAVIASDTGGLREIVVDGVTGILRKLDVDAWASVIEGAKVELLREMGVNGRQRFLEIYHSDVLCASLTRLYVTSCNASRRGTSDGEALATKRR